MVVQAGGVFSNGLTFTVTQTPLFYSVTNLGVLSGYEKSVGAAINDRGDVSGSQTITGTAIRKAFVYHGGVITDLASFGGYTSEGKGINSSGQSTGNIRPVGSSLTQHAFFCDGSTLRDLGGLNDMPSTFGFGINSAGHITGEADKTTQPLKTHAFLFNGSTLLDLGIPAGSTYSYGRDLNDAGTIAGFFTFFNNGAFNHAALYQNNAWQDLGTIPGQANSSPGCRSSRRARTRTSKWVWSSTTPARRTRRGWASTGRTSMTTLSPPPAGTSSSGTREKGTSPATPSSATGASSLRP